MAAKDEALCTLCVSSPAYYLLNRKKCDQACAKTPPGKVVQNPVIDCTLCTSSLAYQQIYSKQCAEKCKQAGQDAANAAKDALNSANPLGGLFQANIWLRVAEVGLGIVLIVVGLVKLAPPSVVKNVKTVGKVAALL